MILELDCGNSFIKWRVIGSEPSSVHAEGTAGSDDALLDTLRENTELSLDSCRLVSVRTEEETLRLMQSLKINFGVVAAVAQPAREVAGVRNGYEEYARLGLDRWLALLAGSQLAGRACLVLDFGTAVTADFVGADGEHLGGFICPGMSLMRNQLRTHTRRIRYDDDSAERSLEQFSPGKTTVEAVERGCAWMLRGFVLAQLGLAREYWGDDFTAFITGGDAALVNEVAPEAIFAPDLVFVGLALACPLS